MLRWTLTNTTQFIAGELLSKYPVSEDRYDHDQWGSWLSYFTLTRKDGLWLSDGADSYPLDIRTHLMVAKKKGLAITGDKQRLLSILGIVGSKIGDDLIVNGSWKSMDGLSVDVMSAIVVPEKSILLAAQLAKTQAFHAWLPSLEEYEENSEFDRSRHEDNDNDFFPWIVRPSSDPKLDRDDPYGVSNSLSRPRLRKEVISSFNLKKGDSFGRTWMDRRGQVVIKTESWGHPARYKDDHDANSRLLVSSEFLKRLLKSMDRELILLVNLQRYEESDRYDDKPSKFSNTTAVGRLKKNLEFEYFKGPVNQVLKNKY